ncbi:hypothetical protein PSTT_15003, partial [Puccinia striiformis]
RRHSSIDPSQYSTSPDVPQSTRRESSRLRTPMRRPGFIATETDSRRALVGNRNVPKPGRKQTATTEDADEDGGNEDEVEEIVVDPDDAETPLPEPGWEQEDDNSDVDESDLSGIGFTLK